MRVVHSLAELAGNTTPSVVTIGNFDGIHCGHRLLLDAVLARARVLNAQSVVVTFDPHPTHVLAPHKELPLLTPLPTKLDLLAATGLDLTLVLPFTEELRRWSAADFARTVLHDSLHTLELHEGATFRCGHDAADLQGLAHLGRDLGFTVHPHDPLVARGAPISSSRIRSLLAAGDISRARPLLGRSFSIRSTPAPGRGYGTRYAVPTINLAPYPGLLPANGVYVTTLRVGEGPTARTFRGVTNAGNRPTFGADSFAVETHLLNFEPLPLTESTPLDLTFLHRLRPEQRFDSPDALRTQIGLDVARANRFFHLQDLNSAARNHRELTDK